MENSDDARNSPGERLVTRLKEIGAEVVLHDPYGPGFQGDLYQMARGCDAVMVMVRHQTYLNLDLRQLSSVMLTPVLLDGRRVFEIEQVRKNGLGHQSIGCETAKVNLALKTMCIGFLNFTIRQA